jgi:hypothetical protein
MYHKRVRGSRKFNERMERARQERERRRLEAPAPDSPPPLPLLRRRIVVEDFDFGEVVRHEVRLYRSSRVDCYVVEVDGRRLPGRLGWARVLGLIRKAFVRVGAF